MCKYRSAGENNHEDSKLQNSIYSGVGDFKYNIGKILQRLREKQREFMMMMIILMEQHMKIQFLTRG